MQPLTTLRRSRGKHAGEVYRFQCGDCSKFWNPNQRSRHDPGCPRALRDSLEHRTVRAYLQRPPNRAERARLARTVIVAKRLVAQGCAAVDIELRNRGNQNGWHVRLKARQATNGARVERFINLTWARQRGYVDARQ